jgi:hypothetical protein
MALQVCRVCSRPGRFLPQASSFNVAYYQCDTCNIVWTTPRPVEGEENPTSGLPK